MTESNFEGINLYIEAAHRQLKGAEYNYEGGYFGIAVSRTYYVFLYAASALLLSQDIVRSKHSAVLAAFRQYFVKPGLIEIEFSDTFGKAFDLRQKADYDMVLMPDQIQVQELIGNARKFTQRILRYLEEGNYL